MAADGVIEALSACARKLRGSRDLLARAAVEEQFSRFPELAVRYPPGGRDKCLSDALHTLEVLAESVASGNPSAFAGYASWLAGVLVAVGVPAQDLVEHFVILRGLCVERLPQACAAEAVRHLAAGLEVVGGGSR
jgi:hypothetical protein